MQREYFDKRMVGLLKYYKCKHEIIKKTETSKETIRWFVSLNDYYNYFHLIPNKRFDQAIKYIIVTYVPRRDRDGINEFPLISVFKNALKITYRDVYDKNMEIEKKDMPDEIFFSKFRKLWKSKIK